MEETHAPEESEASTEPQPAKCGIVVVPAPRGQESAWIHHFGRGGAPPCAKGRKKGNGEKPEPEGRGKERTNLG